MNDVIEKPIFDFAAAWAEGNGAKLGECFTDDALFVAFDGTRLTGGKAIGEWHQRPFDTVLRNTTLQIHIDEVRMLSPELALVTSTGGLQNRKRSRRSRKSGDSHETYLVKQIDETTWKLISLQVTRNRPIGGFPNVLIWLTFNFLWVLLARRKG
jgi:uncharacterized protein (TIGR02246 family)